METSNTTGPSDFNLELLVGMVPVVVCRDEDGAFFGYIPTVPGVVSQGETAEETVENVREALDATCKSYRAEGSGLPYVSTHEGVCHAAEWIHVDMTKPGDSARCEPD